MRGTGQWRVLVFVLLSLAAWPAAARAQDSLVVEPEWHDFGPVSAGTTTGAILEVWNDGSDPLTLGSIGFEEGPGPFALGDGECVTGLVLEAGSGCYFVVTFAVPATGGEHEAVVFVEDEAGTEVAFALLTGSLSVPGHLLAEPGALDFGGLPAGMTSPSKPVVVRNAGDTPVTFPSVLNARITGPSAQDFELTANQCVGVLSPGGTCGISVVFRPHGRRFSPAQSVREARVDLYLHPTTTPWGNRVIGVSMPLKGSVPAVAPPPPLPPKPPAVDYGFVEQDLVRLAESVPRLMRGGSRRSLRLPSFRAPTTGRLSVQVRVVGPGRRMRLATGAHTLESAASGRLRFRLGPKARKLLRLPRRTRVKVTVAFKAQATGETFTQALELTVRRPARTTTRKRPARASAARPTNPA